MQTIQTDAMKKMYHEESACGAGKMLSQIRKPMLYPLSYSPITLHDTTSANSLPIRSTSHFKHYSMLM